MTRPGTPQITKPQRQPKALPTRVTTTGVTESPIRDTELCMTPTLKPRRSLVTSSATTACELEGLVAQMDHYARLDDLARFEVPHRAFHSRFVSAAGRRVAATIDELFDYTRRYRVAHGVLPDAGARQAEHRAILDAAATGDVELTIERMAAHYAHTAVNTITALDPAYDPVRLRTTIAGIAPGALTAVAPEKPTG